MSLSLLLIEDSKVIQKVIKSLLKEIDSITFSLDISSSIEEAKIFLDSNPYDCVLLDLTLPDSEPENTFCEIHSAIPEVPIIVTSATIDNTLALEAMKHGAQDFLLKTDLNSRLICKTIIYSIERKKILLEAEEKEKVLRLQIIDLEQEIERKNKLLETSANTNITKEAPTDKIEGLKFNREELGPLLLVDDSRMNQKLTARVLAKEGFEVITANDGCEALEAFSANSFKLVLMDIQMPKMDGVTATKEIRKKHGSASQIIVIALTATSSKDMDKTFNDVGFNDTLSKPVKPSFLKEVLNKYIN